jgi:excisionase family DNA binding protein
MSADDRRQRAAPAGERTQPSDEPDDRLTITVAEVARRLGVSKATVYELVWTRGIPAVRIGRRVLIPRKRFARWLEDRKQKLGAPW